MFVSDCLGINAKGHLTIDEKDTLELAGEYGTPLYVMSETQIRENCRKFRRSFEENYGGNGMALYASKAFCCKAVCRIAQEEGMGLDVVSAGELYTAESIGFPAERIYFHGNNKTPEELVEALRYGVGTIVVDNITELEVLDQIAASMGKTAGIMFRVKPGVDAHTHDFIRTGQIDSKFGIVIPNGDAMRAVAFAQNLSNVRLTGLHCHIGSQVFDVEPFVDAVSIMMDFAREARDQTGFVIEELNLGGGLGIAYNPSDEPISVQELAAAVGPALKGAAIRCGMPQPVLMLEPGRSIVGDAGTTLYTVNVVKHIEGVRTYVAVDGGMADNPRVALYQARYDAVLANKMNEPLGETVSIAGNCCESGDMLIWDITLPRVDVGDIVAVFCTGAYNFSMASNYNRHPRPAAVLVANGQAELIAKRETYADMCRLDVVPPRLLRACGHVAVGDNA